jgi:hypothetical protein
VATVVENREPYTRDVELLFETLRRFGGRMSRARCIAYFVQSAARATVERLASLGVSVKIVDPLDERYVYANKVRMLDPTEDCDYLLALDNDIVICRDFAEQVGGTALAAKPVDSDPLGLELWKKTFNHFAVELPLARFTSSFTLRETIPYFNSGVLLIPKQHVEPLRDQWASFVTQMLNGHNELPHLAEFYFVTDQLALAVALASVHIPYRALPLEMNFPTHRPVHPSFGADRIRPYLLHHHHRTSSTGTILPCDYAGPNEAIRRINQHFKSRRLGHMTATSECSEPDVE